jgi:steroid delta-isomerase-like uncharacterized protein
MNATTSDRIATRLELVREHVRRENAHDLPGIMATFGPQASYDDEPWDEHRDGREAVQDYYKDLLKALPDVRIDVRNEIATDEGVVLEVVVSGTHMGSWRGLPATGRRVEFALCALYSFDQTGKLAGERIYYDRASVLRQVGLYHDPKTALGRLLTALTHPLTMIRAYGRKLLPRRTA